MGNKTSSTDLTSDQLRNTIIQEGGTVLNIFNALSDDDLQRLTTGQVIALLRHPDVDTNKLKEITLYGRSIMTDEAVVHISRHCPSLTHLNVRSCSLLTGAAIKALTGNCKNLTGIYASDCNVDYIPENIGFQASQIKILQLDNNYIEVIPSSIELCDQGQLKLHLYGNPIQTPPREIALDNNGFDADIDAISGYYKETKGVDPIVSDLYPSKKLSISDIETPAPPNIEKTDKELPTMAPSEVKVDCLSIRAFQDSGRIELCNSAENGNKQTRIDVRMDSLQEMNHDGVACGNLLSVQDSIQKISIHDDETVSIMRYCKRHKAKSKTFQE